MIEVKPFHTWVEIGLRAIGLWPNAPNAMWCRAFWALSMGVAQIFQYWYVMTHIKSDALPDIMDSLSATVTYSLMYFKLINLWFNYRIFYKIFEAMHHDWYDHAETAWAITIMRNTVFVSDRCSKLLISVSSMSVILYASNLFLNTNNNGVAKEPLEEKRLLLQMEFPFDSNASPNYEIIIAIQFVHQFLAAGITGMLNTVLLTIILHLGSQIDIIRQKLLTTISNSTSGQSSLMIINTLIRKHQRIINMAENVEKLFTFMALLQFLMNTLTICFLGFVIVVSFGSVQAPLTLLKFFGFYAAITLEAFIFCFAGEYLTNKSKMIGDAAYESPWYELEPRESSALILVILRSQRQLTITIGKVMELSLERFTTILKASVSYMSVLYALY